MEYTNEYAPVFYAIKGSKSALFPTPAIKKEYKGNDITHLILSRYRGLYCRFSTLNRGYFYILVLVPRTRNQSRSKTLLAVIHTPFTGAVILPPAVCAQEEGPFSFPFSAFAHKSCSGEFLSGFFTDRKSTRLNSSHT